MADTVSREKRSEIMSRIRGRDTGPELRLKAIFDRSGLEYCYQPDLPGRPDFLLPSLNATLFVDGCFWHGCPRHYREPKSNVAFWCRKLWRNVETAWEREMELSFMGYAVLRVWEHEPWLRELSA